MIRDNSVVVGAGVIGAAYALAREGRRRPRRREGIFIDERGNSRFAARAGNDLSAMIGVALRLYVPISKRSAAFIAFASGGLISALAIELAFHGAVQLHHLDFSVGAAWLLVGSGFAIGAIIYSEFSRYLEQKGAAVCYATRFREFIQERREHDAKELIELLSRCDLLRHLPP